MAKKEIKIGSALKKKSAGEVKALLTKRYPTQSKEIDAAIAKNFDEDKGAKKLNGETPKKDGNISGTSSKTGTPTKKG